MKLPDLRKRVLAIAKQAYQIGLVPGTAGNFSALDPETRLVAITPSSYAYDIMTVEDIVVVDLEGQVVEGHLTPSSETPMHTRILRERPEFTSVVHTHSPYATAFALLSHDIPLLLTEVAGRFGGTVRVAPFGVPGSDELGKTALEYFGTVPAVLLQSHGVVALGKGPEDALKTAVLVEDQAKVYSIALSMGTPKPLAREQIDAIKAFQALRKKRLAEAAKAAS